MIHPSLGLDQAGLAQGLEALASGSLLQAGPPSDLGHAPGCFPGIPTPEESSGQRHDETGVREPRGQSDTRRMGSTPDEWISLSRLGRGLAGLDLP